MSTPNDASAARKIKRTSFSPWSSVAMSNKSRKDVASPKTARIVGDMLPTSTGEQYASPNGAGHPTALTMRRDWEPQQEQQRRLAGGKGSSETSSDAGQGHVVPPPRGRAKRTQGGYSGPSTAVPTPRSQLKRANLDKAEPPQTKKQLTQSTRNRPLAASAAASPPRSPWAGHIAKVKGSALRDRPLQSPEDFMKHPVHLDGQKRTSDSAQTAPRASSSTNKVADGTRAARSAPKKTPNTDHHQQADRPAAIVFAENHRPYTLYPTPDGKTESGRGALFPRGYKLHDDPEHPFICPVRDCRRFFPKLPGLGGHFSAGHCATTFNDNGDGTLSKVGTYPRQGSAGTPAIVVSRSLLAPDAEPPVKPGIPFLAQAQAMKRQGSNNSNDSARLKRRELSSTGLSKETRIDLMYSREQRDTSPSDSSSVVEIVNPEQLKPRQTEPGPGKASKPEPQKRQRATNAGSSAQVRDELEAREGFRERENAIESGSLDMEIWEVAPGRVQAEDTLENIAFSNAFLSRSKPIPVSEDTSFNVMLIKPGGTTFWDADDDQLRICSVAVGKINVTMGSKSFSLGPNGMFIVRQGQTCKINNKIYMDAVLHCTTILNCGLR